MDNMESFVLAETLKSVRRLLRRRFIFFADFSFFSLDQISLPSSISARPDVAGRLRSEYGSVHDETQLYVRRDSI